MSGDHVTYACRTPRPRRRTDDTLWACPECGRTWVQRRVHTYADSHRLWVATGLTVEELKPGADGYARAGA